MKQLSNQEELDIQYFLQSTSPHLFIEWLLKAAPESRQSYEQFQNFTEIVELKRRPARLDYDDAKEKILEIYFTNDDESVKQFLLRADLEILRRVEKYLDKVTLTDKFVSLARKKNKPLFKMLEKLRAEDDRWKTDLSADLGELGF